MTEESWSGPMTQILAFGHMNRNLGEYCPSANLADLELEYLQLFRTFRSFQLYSSAAAEM
jgi:hypothetical protein